MKQCISLLLIFSLLITSTPHVSAQVAKESAQSAKPNLLGSPLTEFNGDLHPDLTASISQQESPLRHTTLGNSTLVHRLSKKDFRSDEKVGIQVDNVTTNEIKVEITNAEKELVEDAVIEKRTDGENVDVTVFPPEGKFMPGEYTLKVTDATGKSFVQDFTWGVLAINPHKSIYRENEAAALAIAVLDEMGNMVCDAEVTLLITHTTSEGQFVDELSTKNGKITASPTCMVKELILEPDYRASYTVSDAGIYRMILSAKTKNGSYSISDFLTVQESVPFDIARNAATRIYPPETYPVNITITANEDFSGMVTESVPSDFVITQPTEGRKIDIIRSIDSKDDTTITDLIKSLQLSLPFIGNYTLTQGFGEHLLDPLQNDLYASFGMHGHDGADFGMPTGTPILASDDGTVIMAQEKGDYGTTIVIQHTWGRSYYGHLSVLGVKFGDLVKRGDKIGLSGSTGISTGPHLHFGIKPNENNFENGYYGKIDPLAFLGLEVQNPLVDTPYKVISWFVSLKKGETITLSYQYRAPLVSPQFYTTGPLRFYTADGEQFVLDDSSESEKEPLIATDSYDSMNASGSATLIPSVEEQQSYRLIFKEAREWQIAADAVVTIDSTVSTNETTHLTSGPGVVFVSDSIGYAFYVDGEGDCVYAKTTNGGASWPTITTVDSTNTTDCVRIVVWYDQWTPNDYVGNKVHIVTLDAADAYYTEFNTLTDTATTPANISSDKSNAFANTSSLPAISRGRDGDLYIGVHDDAAPTNVSWVKKCTATCTNGSNWADAGTSPLNSDDGDDELVLLPYGTGNNIMLIRYDNSGGSDFQSNIFTDATATWSGWETIDDTANDHTLYEGQWGATVNKDTGNIYMAYVAENTALGGGDDDVRTAFYNGSWTVMAQVVSNDNDGTRSGLGLMQAKIALDDNTGDIYVVYTAQTTPGSPPNATGNVYFRKSTDGMNSFGTASSAINTGGAADIFSMTLNIVPRDRIYVTWTVDGVNDLFGDTIADLTAQPTMEQTMRHGNWFKNGSEKRFTF